MRKEVSSRERRRRNPASRADQRKRRQRSVPRTALARITKSALPCHRDGRRTRGHNSALTQAAASARGDSTQCRTGSALDRRPARRHPHRERQIATHLRSRRRSRDLAASLRNLSRGHGQKINRSKIRSRRSTRPCRRRPGAIAASVLEFDQEQREIHSR